jgi:hypothetical protein
MRKISLELSFMQESGWGKLQQQDRAYPGCLTWINYV